MADVIPLLVYLIFESNSSIKPKENIVYTQSDKQNKICNIYRTLIEPRSAYGRAVKNNDNKSRTEQETRSPHGRAINVLLTLPGPFTYITFLTCTCFYLGIAGSGIGTLVATEIYPLTLGGITGVCLFALLVFYCFGAFTSLAIS